MEAYQNLEPFGPPQDDERNALSCYVSALGSGNLKDGTRASNFKLLTPIMSSRKLVDRQKALNRYADLLKIKEENQ